MWPSLVVKGKSIKDLTLSVRRKSEIAGVLESETGSEVVGMIGHTAILYRRQSDPEKWRIALPESKP
ncbi:MAG: YhbY family RNA-binding protein [Deltaproteobacteria bacterium]|nr:YhbY family RNA-binding protein [Deltaproteobacteria bacterium]